MNVGRLENTVGGRSATGCIVAAAAIIVTAMGMITFLSKQFVYGENYLARPVLQFTAWYLFAWIGYAIALRGVGRGGPKTIIGIVLIAVAVRLIVCASNPVLENDFYRYIWDGMVAGNGINPFAAAPAELTVEDIVSDPSQRIAAERVHSRINYPDVKTIYPPLAQFVYYVNGRVFSWYPYGFRYTLMVFDVALIGVLLAVLAQRGLALTGVLIYAWNPLVLKEITNAMHIDIVCAFFLGVFVWAIGRERYWSAFVALMASILVKLTPAVLIPLFLAGVWRRRGWRVVVAMIGASLAVAVASLVLMHWRADEPLAGLQEFAVGWETNGSLFPLLKGLFGVVGMSVDSARQCARVVLIVGFGSILALGCKAVWAAPDTVVDWSLAILVALFLISPVGNPWYLTWLLPFLVVRPSRLVVLLLASTSLYYVNFYLRYREMDIAMFHGLKAIEYGPFFITLLAVTWRRWQCRNRAHHGNGDVAPPCIP